MKNADKLVFKRRLSDSMLHQEAGEAQSSSLEQAKHKTMPFFKKRFQPSFLVTQKARPWRSGTPPLGPFPVSKSHSRQKNTRPNPSRPPPKPRHDASSSSQHKPSQFARAGSLMNSMAHPYCLVEPERGSLGHEAGKAAPSAVKKRAQSIYKTVSLSNNPQCSLAKLSAALCSHKELQAQRAGKNKTQINLPHAVDSRALKELRTALPEALKQITSSRRRDRSNPLLLPMSQVISGLTDFAMKTVQTSGKARFDFNELQEFLSERNFDISDADPALQQLIRAFVESYQRMVICNEVFKMLEEENVDIEYQLTQAYTDHYSAVARAGSANPSAPQRLRIDLTSVLKQQPTKETPKGFHQEFMALLPNFSQSWRKLCGKEAADFHSTEK